MVRRCSNSTASMMKGHYASDQERRAMMGILQRLHQMDIDGHTPNCMEDSAGAATDETLPVEDAEALGNVSTDTIARIMLSECDADFDFHALPAKDQAALLTALAETPQHEVIKPWQPWWTGPEAFRIRLSNQGQALVSAVPAGSDASDADEQEMSGLQTHTELSSRPPAPPDAPIPALESISKAPPSPLLHYVLLQTLFAYCCIMRVHNGDPHADIQSYIASLWHLCPFLSTSMDSSSLPATLQLAVYQAAAALRTLDLGPAQTDRDSVALFSSAVWADVAMLCSAGRAAVVCALADLHRQHQACEQTLRSERQDRVARRPGCRQLGAGLKKIKLCLRKLEFLLSLSHAQAGGWYSRASQDIGRCLQTSQQDDYAQQHLKDWQKTLLVTQQS
jgi:hypothetical protein